MESSQTLLPQQQKKRGVKAQRKDVQNEEMCQEKPRGTGESLFWKGVEDEVSAPRRRYWGSVELQDGDPLVWRSWNGKETFWERVRNIVILLKCQNCSVEEASSSSNVEYLDPEVEDLLRSIEKDTISMSLDESQGKLKAYIVPEDVPISEKYMMETAIIKGQERLGRLGCNFKRTTYGKLRVEVDAKCGNIRMEHNAQNQKQRELGGQIHSTNQKQNKMGLSKKSLIMWIGCCCCCCD